MRLRRSLVAAAAVAILGAMLATAPPAQADALGELEKAHNAYVAHQYESAATRLRVLLDPKTGTLKDPDSIADARMYLAAVLLAQGKKDEASAIFEQLLIDKPDYQADPLRVSLEGIDALIDSRTRLHDRLAQMQVETVRKEQEVKARLDAERQKAAARVSMLEKLAAEEVVVERNSRLLALLPFGAGQFQNGQEAWGWTFLMGESVLALASGVGLAVSYYDQSLARDAFRQANLDAANTYQARAQQGAIVGDLLAAGFWVSALAGIIQAELAFVPERSYVRKRDVPQLSLQPLFGPESFGVGARF
ncbi:MAG: hypothetical protein M3O50_11795 [Myxococcota bacterium]|nr:hypothetical protein [Myxococcota bacterium]